MRYFLFTCIESKAADGKVQQLAGIMYDTPRGLYEVFMNAEGDEVMFFNCVRVKGLPIEGPHGKDVEKIFNKFNGVKDKLQQYAMTKNTTLWWELKEIIAK